MGYLGQLAEALAAIATDPQPLMHVAEPLWSDQDFVRQAIRIHGCAMRHAEALILSLVLNDFRAFDLFLVRRDRLIWTKSLGGGRHVFVEKGFNFEAGGQKLLEARVRE